MFVCRYSGEFSKNEYYGQINYLNPNHFFNLPEVLSKQQ